jgi:hypothetical protein
MACVSFRQNARDPIDQNRDPDDGSNGLLRELQALRTKMLDLPEPPREPAGGFELREVRRGFRMQARMQAQMPRRVRVLNLH